MVRRFAPRAVAMALAFAVAVTPARRARADPLYGGLQALAILAVAALVVGGITVGAGATFTAHDGSDAAKGQPPQRGWSIAETAITTPLAVIFDVGLGMAQADEQARSGPPAVLLLVGGMWMSGLATHGIWSLASDKVAPPAQFGVSMAVGANIALTTGAIGAAAAKRLGGVAYGALEMAFTVPSGAVGVYKLLDPKLGDKPAWAALTVWSGVLFVHGTASLIEGAVRKERAVKPPAERDAAFSLAPVVLGMGQGRAPGIVAFGRF